MDGFIAKSDFFFADRIMIDQYLRNGFGHSKIKRRNSKKGRELFSKIKLASGLHFMNVQ